MSENVFWLALWTVVGSVVIALAIIVSNYHRDENAEIIKLINEGVDATAVTCALDPPRNNSMCLIYVMEKEHYGPH